MNRFIFAPRQLNFLLVFFVAIFLQLKIVVGCSCIGKSTVGDEINHSSLVAVGTIISKNAVEITDSTQVKLFPKDTAKHRSFPFTIKIVKYEMKIDQLYKGDISNDIITIYTGGGSGDCGYEFNVGNSFVIYGFDKTYFGKEYNDYPYPEGKNIFWTNICTRTSEFDQAEVDSIRKCLTDSIFAEFKKCCRQSRHAKVLWKTTSPGLPGKDEEGLSQQEKTSGYLNDPEKIIQFIDSFPVIMERPDKVESIKAMTNSCLYFICRKDTMLTFEWDPGKFQISITKRNKKETRKIDFDSLYKSLGYIKLKE